MRRTDHAELAIVTFSGIFITRTRSLSLGDLRFWNVTYGIQNVMNCVMNVVMNA